LLANPLGADLLVMGSHPAAEEEPPGALVRTALHHAPCTVMVTPRTP
jgi:nucleotide-binding universal stress UspA family protein